MVLHRRAGKTTAVLNHLQRDCIRVPNSQFAYIGPTYKQSKRIAWEIAKFISRNIPGVQYNESELIIRYPNNSRLILVGSENPDSLRGIALWGAAFDEYSQQPSNVFSEIISKALADHLGYAIFFGTPKGKNEFYRLYQAGKSDQAWTVVYRTIDDSLRDEVGETIENLRTALEDDRKLVAAGLMTQEEFDQEWYCSFEAAIKGAYYAKQISTARNDNRIREIPYDPALPVFDVWDLGTGPQIGVGLYQAVGHARHMIGYLQGEVSDGLPQMIAKLQKLPYVWGKHFAPHDIRATDQSTGKTRWETAKNLNWEFEIIPGMSVDDGIEAGRLFFPRLYVDEKKCALWLDAIAQYHQEWDDNRGMFLEKPYHDWTSHPADVHRYASIVSEEMRNEPGKPFVPPDRPRESVYEGRPDEPSRHPMMQGIDLGKM
jgi:phage terminase large subunit